MEKVWEIKNPDDYRKAKQSAPSRPSLPREEKDPAAAYSRSLLVWGLGQLYNDQVVKGAVFLVLMVLMVFAVVLGVIYRGDIVRFLLGRGISRSRAFLAVETAIFFAVLFWISNAADAYRSAAIRRTTPFRGVAGRITPLLGSLLMPGWGQFLNGQPLKGALCSVFTVFTGFSVLSVIITYLAWPSLDGGDARFIIEEIFAVCLCLVPLTPLLWTFSAYDAFKVSGDNLLKEPLRERIKAAWYRGRNQGWVRGVFPQIKGTVMLALFLAFFLIVVHYWFPAGYYLRLLASIRTFLSDRGMSLVPELIARALALLGK